MGVRKPKLKDQLAKLEAHNTKPSAVRHRQKQPTSVPNTKTGQLPVEADSKHVPIIRRHIIPYSLDDSILLIGEANFSFALALAQMLGSGEQIIATTNESQEITQLKYPDAADNIHEFSQIHDGTCLYDVDGTKLHKHAILRKRMFTKIVFMFPHVGKGIKNQDRNILENQKLILDFFRSCICISDLSTEIIVTTKTGPPYDQWDIKKLAKSSGLVCKRTFSFSPEPYMGYEHRRTLGHDKVISSPVPNSEIKSAKTFIFTNASDGTL